MKNELYLHAVLLALAFALWSHTRRSLHRLVFYHFLFGFTRFYFTVRRWHLFLLGFQMRLFGLWIGKKSSSHFTPFFWDFRLRRTSLCGYIEVLVKSGHEVRILKKRESFVGGRCGKIRQRFLKVERTAQYSLVIFLPLFVHKDCFYL